VAAALIRQAAADENYSQNLHDAVNENAPARHGLVGDPIEETELGWLAPSEWLWFARWRQDLGGSLDPQILSYLDLVLATASRASRLSSAVSSCAIRQPTLPPPRRCPARAGTRRSACKRLSGTPRTSLTASRSPATPSSTQPRRVVHHTGADIARRPARPAGAPLVGADCCAAPARSRDYRLVGVHELATALSNRLRCHSDAGRPPSTRSNAEHPAAQWHPARGR
jgi:hypothetical protein